MISTPERQASAKTEANFETLILLSADETGRIPFPDGNYREVSAHLEALHRLDEKGHVERRFENDYLSFYLTKSGELLKSQLVPSGNHDGQPPSPSAAPNPSLRRALLTLALAALLLSAGRAQARLGESPARLEARYGTPVKFGNGSGARDFECTYKHSGITIVVHFLDEKSQYESYSNDSGDPIATEEIQRLLEINRRGGKWKVKEDTDSSKKWEMNSGEALAGYQPKGSHALEIKTVWWQHFVDQHPIDQTNGAIERLKDF